MEEWLARVVVGRKVESVDAASAAGGGAHGGDCLVR